MKIKISFEGRNSKKVYDIFSRRLGIYTFNISDLRTPPQEAANLVDIGYFLTPAKCEIQTDQDKNTITIISNSPILIEAKTTDVPKNCPNEALFLTLKKIPSWGGVFIPRLYQPRLQTAIIYLRQGTFASAHVTNGSALFMAENTSENYELLITSIVESPTYFRSLIFAFACYEWQKEFINETQFVSRPNDSTEHIEENSISTQVEKNGRSGNVIMFNKALSNKNYLH